MVWELSSKAFLSPDSMNTTINEGDGKSGSNWVQTAHFNFDMKYHVCVSQLNNVILPAKPGYGSIPAKLSSRQIVCTRQSTKLIANLAQSEIGHSIFSIVKNGIFIWQSIFRLAWASWCQKAHVTIDFLLLNILTIPAISVVLIDSVWKYRKDAKKQVRSSTRISQNGFSRIFGLFSSNFH